MHQNLFIMDPKSSTIYGVHFSFVFLQICPLCAVLDAGSVSLVEGLSTHIALNHPEVATDRISFANVSEVIVTCQILPHLYVKEFIRIEKHRCNRNHLFSVKILFWLMQTSLQKNMGN